MGQVNRCAGPTSRRSDIRVATALLRRPRVNPTTDAASTAASALKRMTEIPVVQEFMLASARCNRSTARDGEVGQLPVRRNQR